jgi:hypothetical protein
MSLARCASVKQLVHFCYWTRFAANRLARAKRGSVGVGRNGRWVCAARTQGRIGTSQAPRPIGDLYASCGRDAFDFVAADQLTSTVVDVRTPPHSFPLGQVGRRRKIGHDAERMLLRAEQQYATSTTNVSLNLLQLFKALGGGWEPTFPSSPGGG